jgi:GAF domain-containing protein
MPISQAEADILQLLADQLAATIQSARLATEARSTVQQLQAVTSESTRSLWAKYLGNSTRAYQFTTSGVKAIPAEQATAGLDALRAPISLRGQQIGSIALRQRSGGAWTAGEQDLLEKVAAQVGLALENVRLLEETKQRAAEEQIIGEISARFSRSLDVDALLQAAAREFAALPDVAEATVMLKPTDERDLHTAN